MKKYNICLTDITKNIIIGLILSDARLQKNGKFSRMTIEQKDKDFVYHIWDIFNKERIVGAKPVKRIKRQHPEMEYISYRFNTITQPYLDDQYNIWYMQIPDAKQIQGYKNKKILPKEYLIKNFNIYVQIYMIAGDGYYEKANKFIGICTDNFTQEEVEFQIDLIEKNIKIKCSLMKHKNRYRIRINKSETKKLWVLINNILKTSPEEYTEFFPKGMEYKFYPID